MTDITYHLGRIARGAHLILKNYIGILAMLLTTGLAVNWLAVSIRDSYTTPISVIIAYALFWTGVSYLIGVPWPPVITHLAKAGITDSEGNTPKLIRREYDCCNDMLEYEFYSVGLPADVWEKKKQSIESALNITITSINYGVDYRYVIVRGKPGNIRIPEYIEWQDNYMIRDDAQFVLGRSLFGDIIINLNRIPMWLIGGSTGSGKSILVKLIARQCILKGIDTYIIDFKGGADYGCYYQNQSHFITDIEKLQKALITIIDELEKRKTILRDCSEANIADYNNHTTDKLQRIVIIFDEVAEVLEKNGLSKEDKRFIQEEIESRLSTIARLGRAAGIHLILSIQRPDADVLTGQIRSNVTGRIAGRCDNNLSMLILDSTEAADAIDNADQGVFIINDDTHTKFKGYYLTE